MSNIFASYSHRDSNNVNWVLQRIADAGHNIWVDIIGIQAGENWREEIVAAIDKADAVIVFVSPNSIYSDNVRKELDLAETANKTILPVIIEQTPIPPQVKWQLAGLQSIDLTTDLEYGLSVLLNSIQQIKTVDPGLLRQMRVEISPLVDGIFHWRGHEIAVRSVLQPWYLFMASDTLLFVDGRLIARGGGFTFGDEFEGSFVHRGETCKIKCYARSSGREGFTNCSVAINGQVIQKFELPVRNRGCAYGMVIIIFLIGASCTILCISSDLIDFFTRLF